MAKILLDFAFPISVIESIAGASTAWLNKVCVVVEPKAGVDPGFYTCTNQAQVAAKTDNLEVQQLFAGGLSSVLLLVSNDLSIATELATKVSEFYTVLISSDFTSNQIMGVKASVVKTHLTFTALLEGTAGNGITIAALDTADAGDEVVTVVGSAISVAMESTVSTTSQIKAALEASAEAMELLGSIAIASGQESTAVTAFAASSLAGGVDPLDVTGFDGVVGAAFTSKTVAQTFATASKRAGFYSAANGAKNMMYAFGKLLSGASWNNQQYISMPVTDGVTALGDADELFDNRVSFALDDDEFGKRLGMFSAGGKAIAAPYILKELRINLASCALSWIASNQPSYTKRNAALLEEALDDTVMRPAIEAGDIESATVSILADQGNFVASGSISVPTPRALWRVETEMQET